MIHTVQKLSTSMLAMEEARAVDSPSAPVDEILPAFVALIKLLPDVGISVVRDLGPAVELVIRLLTP